MRRVLNNFKYHKNWLSYHIYKFFGDKSRPFVFKTRNGMELAVTKRMQQTYKEMFFDETYIKGFSNQQVLRQSKTIIDIGSNVGYFTHYCLNESPKAKVLCFEPMPRNFEQLQSYTSTKQDYDVTAFQKAVGGEVGEIELGFDDSEEITTSAGVLQTKEGAELTSIKVPCTTLSAIQEEHELSEIDFLKIDCEGAEYEILSTSPDELWANVKNIAMETHPGSEPNQNSDWVCDFLKGKGFEVNRIEEMVYGTRV